MLGKCLVKVQLNIIKTKTVITRARKWKRKQEAYNHFLTQFSLDPHDLSLT